MRTLPRTTLSLEELAIYLQIHIMDAKTLVRRHRYLTRGIPIRFAEDIWRRWGQKPMIVRSSRERV